MVSVALGTERTVRRVQRIAMYARAVVTASAMSRRRAVFYAQRIAAFVKAVVTADVLAQRPVQVVNKTVGSVQCVEITSAKKMNSNPA